MSRRAVVIGAGAIGVASAYYLNRSGWEVTLVDRGEVASGCSYGTACLIVPSHSDPVPTPGVVPQALKWMLRPDSPFYVKPRVDVGLLRWVVAFRRYCNHESAHAGFRALAAHSRESLELYEELIQRGDADFFYERKGLLEICYADSILPTFESETRELVQHGFDSRTLSRAEVLEMEPGLNPKVAGGKFTEGEAHGFSLHYVRSLADSVQRLGGTIRTGVGIEQIQCRSGRVEGVVVEGSEEIRSELVVLAAGAWSARLAARLGVSVPLQPAKGYSCTIDSCAGAPRVPIIIKDRRVIVTPLDNRLRFGGTMELSGFDLDINPRRYGAVVRAGLEAFKTPPPLQNEEKWAGLRPLTPDGLPIISRVPGLDGLIVATGHAMLGFTQSPATGKLVAALADGNEPAVDNQPFHIGRF